MANPNIRLVYEAEIATGLKSGDGGGTFDDMDARIKVLEYRAEQADKLFARIDSKLDALAKDVSEVKGRINAMPTTWQLLGMILAVMGASFAIIRFGLAIL